MEPMDLHVKPEPEPEEREALERAVATLLGAPRDARSEWWREGLRETLSPQAEPS